MERKHSGLKFTTLVQRHTGEATHRSRSTAKLGRVTATAGTVKSGTAEYLPEKVWLNPEKE